MGQVIVRLRFEQMVDCLDEKAAEPLAFQLQPLIECRRVDLKSSKKIALEERCRLPQLGRHARAGEALELQNIDS